MSCPTPAHKFESIFELIGRILSFRVDIIESYILKTFFREYNGEGERITVGFSGVITDNSASRAVGMVRDIGRFLTAIPAEGWRPGGNVAMRTQPPSQRAAAGKN